MKKYYLFFGVVVLLSAGCNSANTQSVPQQKEQSQTQQSQSQISPTSSPSGAETDYIQVLNRVAAKCGNDIHLLYVITAINPVGSPHSDSYFFTPGTCGNPDQSLSLVYNKDTQTIDPEWQLAENTDETLQSISLLDWKMSYTKAVDYALQNGGQDYVTKYPGVTAWNAILSNQKGQDFRWTIRFRDNNDSKIPILKIYIDPTTGKFLGKG